MFRKSLFSAVIGAVIFAVVPAGAANAQQHSPGGVTAWIQLTARPDSGGNGNWATDS